MEIVKGGFALNSSDEKTLYQQRAITQRVNNDFIQVGATFLKMSSKNPAESDWYRHKFRDTNLQQWIDNPDYKPLNVGFNLQFGWLDVDIDSPDERYNKCIISAFKHLGIDTRFSFGRLSKGIPSHVLVQLADADMNNYDAMKEFEPKEFKIGGNRYKTELRSMGPITDSPNAVKQAKQTVMPGSVYSHKTDPGKYDISVWYNKDGKVATHVTQIAETTPHRTYFEPLIGGIAFGTFLYVMQPHWVEGSRQNLAIKVAGWLARIVKESIGINQNEGVSRGTFCPIGSEETAEGLLDFVCTELGDPEAYMRKRTFRDALKKLTHNPDAKIPGWPALEKEIGSESMMAIRTVFMPGIDVSPLTRMADNYVYDDSSDNYIDRERFEMGVRFVFDGNELDRRHRNDFIEVAGKSKPLFKIFEASPLRRRIKGRDLYPDLPSGVIFRTYKGEVVPDDQDQDKALTLFNTWRGWPFAPTAEPKQPILDQCNRLLTRLFGYLTQDNADQAEWLKQWLAWTVQFPGQKQQIAPVFVGGQGVGKSFFGNTFLGEVFGSLWGSASPKILEGAFSVEPFINRMFVFIDEAKFHSEASTDEIKKIIRNVDISGAEKFQSAQNHRIFSRVIFASNKFEMNIGQQNIQDRALFYMKAYDKEYLRKTEREFLAWAVTIKPFFNEFIEFLKRREHKEHFMYIFNTIPVARAKIEDVTLSSGSDKHIVESNMAYPRRVVKHIIEEGRIWEDLDISAPFTRTELERRIIDTCTAMGLRNVQQQHILAEMRDAGLLAQVMIKGTRYWKFKYKIGTLTDKYSEAIGVQLESRFEFSEDDYGDNEITEFVQCKPWRGSNSRFRNGI